MSYDIRSYDTDEGDPVVVMVVKGTHDVSRLVQMLTHGNCDQAHEGFRLIARLKRHNKGRMALALLKAHGGADFTDDDDQELVAAIRRAQGIPEPLSSTYALVIDRAMAEMAKCGVPEGDFPVMVETAALGYAAYKAQK